MFFAQEPVEFQCPGSEETGFTTDELQQLLSLFQSGDSVGPNFGSEGSSRAVYKDYEKKLRRMKSNRESARRCRWRKKRQLDDLKDQVSRLEMENQELKNRLGLALHQSHVIGADNQRLINESKALCARLSDLYRVLFTMQSP